VESKFFYNSFQSFAFYKLQTYIFMQDCDKRLEIVAVLFRHHRDYRVRGRVSIEGRSRQVVKREWSEAI